MSFIRAVGRGVGEDMATYRPGRRQGRTPKNRRSNGDSYVWSDAPRTIKDGQGRRFTANSGWVDRSDAERVQRSLNRQGKSTKIRETFRGWVVYSRTRRS